MLFLQRTSGGLIDCPYMSTASFGFAALITDRVDCCSGNASLNQSLPVRAKVQNIKIICQALQHQIPTKRSIGLTTHRGLARTCGVCPRYLPESVGNIPSAEANYDVAAETETKAVELTLMRLWKAWRGSIGTQLTVGIDFD